MSKHLTSVSFHSKKGSVIHVEAELHHDIDYSFFDSPENVCEKKRSHSIDNKDKKKGITAKLSNINLQGNRIENKISEEINLSRSSTVIESDEYEDDFEDDDDDDEQQQKEKEEVNKKEDNNTSQAFDDNEDVELGRMPVVQEESEEFEGDNAVLGITSKHSQVGSDGNKASGMPTPQVPNKNLNHPKSSTSKQKVELCSNNEGNSKYILHTNSEIIDSKNEKGKAKKASVVRFNQTSTKKSSEDIKKQSLKMKKQHPKELMNCIAYSETKNYDESKTTSPSPDFLSVSTDTTSEITDVTTRPSSSGCSSLAKNDFVENTEMQKKGDTAEGKRSKPSMKFLLETLNSLERQKRLSMTPSVTSLDSRNGIKRRNMSFSNDQLRHIERENAILLRKLEELRKPSQKSLTRAQTVIYPRLSSSAINRRKEQLKINRDNLILLRKIDEAKPTLPTRRSLMRT